MEFTVQVLDSLCGRLDRVTTHLTQAAGNSASWDELSVSEIVLLIQRVGEGIAWAYGQSHQLNLGELFAQPFVDRRTRDQLKVLLDECTAPTQKPNSSDHLRNRVVAQILQTILILLEATPKDSTLFCNLTAGWYLNDVVSFPFDFSENEDLLPLWITVVKHIVATLSTDNIMLFFNPTSESPFPLFAEAVRFYHHPSAQVRTHVQAISLDIFMQLRGGQVEVCSDDPLLSYIVAESSVFFTHVCCLLRDFWKMVDDSMRSWGSRREVRNALSIQNDILVYISDVFSCDIPQLSAVLQEKLLRFAVLPVLVRSAIAGRCESGRIPRLPPTAGGAGSHVASVSVSSPSFVKGGNLTSSTALYLLCDALATIKCSSVMSAAVLVMLRPCLPEEILEVVLAPPPRTPLRYFEAQRLWQGPGIVQPSGCFVDDTVPLTDATLYSMPPVPLARLFVSSTETGVQNKLVDYIKSQFNTLSQGDAATCSNTLLASVALALRSFRNIEEQLAISVTEEFAFALCAVLTAFERLDWATLETAIGTLRELCGASDSPSGRAQILLGPIFEERLVRPLAATLWQEVRHLSEPRQARDKWLGEFEEQWHAHVTPSVVPTAESRMREFLDPPEIVAGVQDVRARALRILFAARELAVGKLDDSMPAIDHIEADEEGRFKTNCSMHVGKINRVKCRVRGLLTTLHETEALYLLQAQATLLLVRPDACKPLWGIPIVVEPLRSVRFGQDGDNSEPLEQLLSARVNSDEQQSNTGHQLRLKVAKPRSPYLQKLLSATPAGKLVGPMVMRGYPSIDLSAANVAGSVSGSGLEAASHGVLVDRFAHSMPAVMTAGARGGLGVGESGPSASHASGCEICLLFADERRRRVACNLLWQAKQAVQRRRAETLVAFLSKVMAGG
eukprot:TRINITY_DN48810_c0_g1_i1.p1 TRINITY_DN48810_c0_g1~~TRINITY_DN48810_c0_g1_i1.p1  ORF type:complete len:916 (-),score=105.94 TRINITY_DN48810_c0_g1_i1:339-3044(-)